MKQLHVEEGIMTCRGCGHAYPVSNGIPNMVSHQVWYNKEKSQKEKGTDKFVFDKLLAEHEVGR